MAETLKLTHEYSDVFLKAFSSLTGRCSGGTSRSNAGSKPPELLPWAEPLLPAACGAVGDGLTRG